MADQNSLVNFGDLAKPATTLIEKLADAVGCLYEPTHIRRKARAEVDAAKIQALGRLELSAIEERALYRLKHEATRNQQNLESIIRKALPEVGPEAEPDQIETDWLTYFTECARRVSDDEMQLLWGRILAEKANEPGRYSKRTLALMSTIDREDADALMLLRRFCVRFPIDDVTPLVYSVHDSIYQEHDLTFGILAHLDDIGLISFDIDRRFNKIRLPRDVCIDYFGSSIPLRLLRVEDNAIPIGQVIFSKAGEDLAALCQVDPIPGFLEYLSGRWSREGLLREEGPPAN